MAVVEPLASALKAELLSKTGENIASPENRLGRELRNALTGSETPDKFLSGVQNTETQANPADAFERGRRSFSKVFAEFETQKPWILTEDPRIAPETRRSLEIFGVPFEERRELFFPKTALDFLQIYRLRHPAALGYFLLKERLGFSMEHLRRKCIVGGPSNYSYVMGLTTHLDGKPFRNPPIPGSIARVGKDLNRFGYLYEQCEYASTEKFRESIESYWEEDCRALKLQLLKEVDGRRIDANYIPKADERLVVLRRHRGNSIDLNNVPDWDFMVRENDGTWSYKQTDAPTKLDDLGKVITNPEKCSTYCEEIVGYYILKPEYRKA